MIVFTGKIRSGLTIMDARLINVFEFVVVFSAVCYAALLGCVLLWWRPRFFAAPSIDL